MRCGEPAFDEPEPFEYIGRCGYCQLEVVGEQDGYVLEWRETGDEQEKWKKCPRGCLLVLKWQEMPYTVECPICMGRETRSNGLVNGWYCMRCRVDWKVGVDGAICGYWRSLKGGCAGVVSTFGYGEWVDVPEGCLLILVEKQI